MLRVEPSGRLRVDVLEREGGSGWDAPAGGRVPVPEGRPALALAGPALRELRKVFLPRGYPNSVGPGYLEYVGWQWAHHAAASANGVLASSFLLYAVGLGSGAIPTAGALNWVLKDGIGQLGTLLFGRFLGHRFDVQAKSWYLAASAKLNAGMALEMATFAAPSLFLPLGSAANAVKGLAWMCGGSTRSAFNVGFARANNVADITAKATSQTISSFLAGNSVGMATAAAVGQDLTSAYAAFAAFAAVHMYSGWRSARLVPLQTLNPIRLQILAAAFVAGAEGAPALSPSEVARLEPVPFMPPYFEGSHGPKSQLVVGPDIGEAWAGDTKGLRELIQEFEGEHYLLWTGRQGESCVVLHHDAEPACVLRAALHAALARTDRDADGDPGGTLAKFRARRLTGDFLAALERAGWLTDRLVVEAAPARATWSVNP